MSKTIVFFNHHLDLRGTNTSMYNFAHYNETILGNKSIIASFEGADQGDSSYEKFKNRFETILIQPENLDIALRRVKADFFYHQRFGTIDFIPFEVPALIHVAFSINEPHGYKYFYVSECLARMNNKDPSLFSVPLMVDYLPSQTENIRSSLGISKDQLVFGYHGNNFDIPWVRQEVENIAKNSNDFVFIFMHTNHFHTSSPKPENIKYIDGTWDMQKKSNFIHSCDAMIDGCTMGQTFGMSIAEFALCNKPIITWKNPPVKAHIDYIGNKALLYEDSVELNNIITNFRNISKHSLYEDCYESCLPHKAIKRFESVCLL